MPHVPGQATSPVPPTLYAASEPPHLTPASLVALDQRLLPRQNGFPAQGSFQTHRRTVSAGHIPAKNPSPASVSPGPANVTLSRGINVETGKRNNDNAMIAAAALAAAADIPLPLKNKKREVSGSSSAPGSVSRLKGTANILNPEKAAVIKAEDSVMTEPEEDENRTEDEPISESKETESIGSIPMVKAASLGHVVQTGQQQGPPPAMSAAVGSGTAPVAAPPIASAVNLNKSAPVSPSVQTSSSKLTDVSSSQTDSVPIKDEQTTESFVPPALEEFKVDPDSGIIGCICGIEEDDGFTIQCDICFRWQHCSCMGYKTNEEVPEDVYKCYFCDAEKWNKFDPEKCREDTLARLDLDKVSSEPQVKLVPPKRKSLSSGGDEKKRRKSERDMKSSERPTTEKRKSSSSAVNASPQMSSSNATFEINNKDNPLLQDGVTAEQYQGVYYKLENNDFKTAEVKKKLSEWGHEAEEKGIPGIEVMSLSDFNSIKFSKVIMPNHQRYLQERKEIRRAKGYNEAAIQVKAYSENPKQKFVGISKVGLFISKRAELADSEIIPSGTAIIEYLGEVDLLELYMSNAANQYSTWGTVKPQVARVDLPILEEGSVSIVLDARFVGNEARFIRKSCSTTANCEIKSFYIPQLQTFKHVVYTTKPIALKGENTEEELRLKWEWDRLHPINKMIIQNAEGAAVEGKKFDDFSDEEKVLLVSGVDTILNFVECACNTTPVNLQCAIFKIKKATSYLLRSTRKASSLTNIAFNKSKEELVMPKKHRQFVSWKERLSERDNLLHMSIFSIDNEGENSEGSIDGDSAILGDQDDALTDPEAAASGEAGNTSKSPHNLPYKRQLLARAKSLASRKYVTEKADTSFESSSHVPKVIAVPLVHDILVSIKESVNDSLKPLAKISSNVNIVANGTEMQRTGSETKVQPSWKEASPGVVPSATETVAPEPKQQAPPVVKKLSFADYKKKMK